MTKIAIVFATVGLLFGAAYAAESEKEVTITAKPQVPEQTIKIELEVPDIKVDIPPVKIEPATSQVDVGTVITQVEGYYDHALNRIFNTIILWSAFIGIIVTLAGVGVTVALWFFGKREKKRQTDFNKITAELRDTQEALGIQISNHGLLKSRVEKEISDLEVLKVRLEEQEKALDKSNDFMVDALIKAFSNIGALHIENTKYAFAVENGMMAIQLYAYNPKKNNESGIDAILSGITGMLSGQQSKEEVIRLFKEEEKLALADYEKMKENNVPRMIIEKYEKIMSKAGIDYKK